MMSPAAFLDLRKSAFICGSFWFWIEKHRVLVKLPRASCKKWLVFAKMTRNVVVSRYSLEDDGEKTGGGMQDAVDSEDGKVENDE